MPTWGAIVKKPVLKFTVLFSTQPFFSNSHATPPTDKRPGPKRVAPAAASQAPSVYQ